jgi:hypothetical protein
VSKKEQHLDSLIADVRAVLKDEKPTGPKAAAAPKKSLTPTQSKSSDSKITKSKPSTPKIIDPEPVVRQVPESTDMATVPESHLLEVAPTLIPTAPSPAVSAASKSNSSSACTIL